MVALRVEGCLPRETLKVPDARAAIGLRHSRGLIPEADRREAELLLNGRVEGRALLLNQRWQRHLHNTAIRRWPGISSLSAGICSPHLGS